MRERFDVIVVGGGPAGAATAASLARLGHYVLVLEKAKFPREKPCAEYFSPGTMDVLERLGAMEKVSALNLSLVRGMRIFGRHNSFLQSYADSQTGLCSRHAMGISRPLFDNALLTYARDCGAEVREHIRVSDVIVEDGRVAGVRARSGYGDEQTISASFVVGADGVHSVISRSLGLNADPDWPRRIGLVARYEGAAAITDYGEMHTGRKVYCGLAPVGNGLVNVGLVEDLERPTDRGPMEPYFDKRVAEFPGVRAALGPARRVTPVRGIGPLAHKVRNVVGPGYLLVGDAAGFRDPFTGEGIYRALRGAELATASLEAALREESNVPIGYAAARRSAFADKERVCSLVQFFLGKPKLFDYVIDRLAARAQVARGLTEVLGDYSPAGKVLRPRYLWSLLKP